MTTMTRVAMAAVMAMAMVACGGSSAPVVTALEVTPRTVSLDEGASAPLTVMAIYDDGSTENVTSQVTWETTDSVVAGVSQGSVEAYTAGATDLTARWNGHAATARVEVSPILAALFGLAPSPTTPGALAMMGLFTDGSIKPVTLALSWTSTRPDRLTISDAGVLTPVAAGPVWIQVTVAGQLFSIKVQVNADLTISIGI